LRAAKMQFASVQANHILVALNQPVVGLLAAK
jgi:hypothetical protein